MNELFPVFSGVSAFDVNPLMLAFFPYLNFLCLVLASVAEFCSTSSLANLIVHPGSCIRFTQQAKPASSSPALVHVFVLQTRRIHSRELKHQCIFRPDHVLEIGGS